MIQVHSPAAISLAAEIKTLDPTHDDTRAKIAFLRQQMDVACDNNQMPLAEWRMLVDLVTEVRSQCKGAQDVRGNNGLSTD